MHSWLTALVLLSFQPMVRDILLAAGHLQRWEHLHQGNGQELPMRTFPPKLANIYLGSTFLLVARQGSDRVSTCAAVHGEERLPALQTALRDRCHRRRQLPEGTVVTECPLTTCTIVQSAVTGSGPWATSESVCRAGSPGDGI